MTTIWSINGRRAVAGAVLGACLVYGYYTFMGCGEEEKSGFDPVVPDVVDNEQEEDEECVVKELWLYPVKSFKGCKVSSAVVEKNGFRYDRRWMVIDGETNGFISMRRNALMALVEVEIVENSGGNISLILRSKMIDHEINVPVTDGPNNMMNKPVRVWDDYIDGCYDQGPLVAEWLDKALGMSGLRLVYMGDATRKILPDYAIEPTDTTSFADGFPYLVISTSSLRDLNRRIRLNCKKGRFLPMKMNRFRPNIVVSGLKPYEEDTLSSLTIEGDAKFHAVRGCARCKMTTIDMEAGKAPPSLNVEPLVTLNEYRKLGDDVYFGQNLIAEVKNIGKDVKVGDKFEFEKRPAKSPKIIV